MRNTNSVMYDLYGEEPVRREPEHRNATWLLIVLALAGIFVYELVHPVTRLRSDPPPEFVKATVNPKASSGARQESIARAYWNLAAESVSEKYSYGDTLPSNPPRDFTLANGADDGARALYWHRLRELWNQQSTWVTSYQLNTAWINGELDTLRDFARNYMDINI